MTATVCGTWIGYLRLVTHCIVAGDVTPIEEILDYGCSKCTEALASSSLRESVRAMKNVATDDKDASEAGLSLII